MKQLFNVLAAFAVVLAAVLPQSLFAQNACGVEGVVVEASSFMYSPANVEIEAGQTVVWVNIGGTHDVNGVSSTLGENWNNPETFSHPSVSGNMSGVCIGTTTFTVPGVYDYDCSVGSHAAAGMVATVTVTEPAQPATVAEIVIDSPDHTILEQAVVAAGLADDLSSEGPFTVFAPTDAAFAALLEALQVTAEDLLANPDLASILLYHVVSGNVMSTDLTDGMMATTLNGEEIIINITADGVIINGTAMVTVADITADNGVVHVIDAVLLPGTNTTTVMDVITESVLHNSLEAALVAAGLDEALNGAGPFTVFAPTDDAVATALEGLGITVEMFLASPMLEAILSYHAASGTVMSADITDGMMVTMLNGQDITINVTADGVIINNSAMVTLADITADNGVVHVIDAVLLPAPPSNTTVVDIIVDSPDHTVLEAAVIAAGLADDLSAAGPFTVFAPTDAAFTTLLETLEVTAEDLLASPDLASILLYHAASGNVMSTDITDGMMVTTLNGQDLTINLTADGVVINGTAMVTVADLTADNGVVHVIDAVLLPETPQTTTVVDIIVDSPDHTVLEAAVIAAGLAVDLSGDGPFTVFAPTDAAFTTLLETLQVTAEDLLANPDLPSILLYHVASGNVLSGSLSDGQIIETLNGESVEIGITAEGVTINGVAMVVVADLTADNGVVHVIDAVLLPTSSVAEANNVAEVNIYPVPADDFVTIDLEVEGNVFYDIRDITGRVVENGNWTNGRKVLEVSNWTPGIYTFSWGDATNRSTRAFSIR
ncbi:fasciclin domain-containing protein [bacterium]|nr:fasciclin domain-containing protein [bacterium]